MNVPALPEKALTFIKLVLALLGHRVLIWAMDSKRAIPKKQGLRRTAIRRINSRPHTTEAHTRAYDNNRSVGKADNPGRASSTSHIG